VCNTVYCRTIIKDHENHIFVGVAQEVVNHGNTCAMCYDYFFVYRLQVVRLRMDNSMRSTIC